MTSKGEAAVWEATSATEVRGVTASGRIVFSIEQTAGSGSEAPEDDAFTFTLLDQVDHPDDSGETDVSVTIDVGDAFVATDFDGDFVILDGQATIQIQNDAPVLSTDEPDLRTVHEDALNNFNSVAVEGSDGNPDGGVETTTQVFDYGDLSARVDTGADELVRFTLNQDQLFDGTSTGVSSKGDPVSWQVVDATEVQGVAADGRVVFTLTQTAGGNSVDDPTDDEFTFTLLDQVDHPNASGEADASVTIDVGDAFVATDFDGDFVVLDGQLTVAIENDAPIASGETVSVAVQEDALGNSTANADNNDDALEADLSTGNLEDEDAGVPSQQTDRQFFTQVALQSLVIPGADERDGGTLEFALAGAPSGNVQTTAGINVLSNGSQVVYGTDGDDIVGYVEVSGAGFDAATDREVFRLSEQDDGSFAFDLNDQVDHSGNDDDSEILTLNLTSAFTATDFDGDQVVFDANSIQVEVENDIPVVDSEANATVQLDDDAVPNADGNPGGEGDDPDPDPLTVTGSVDYTVGADEVATVTWLFGDDAATLPAGLGLSYASGTDSDTVIVQQLQDGAQVTVLTVNLTSSAGGYSVVQNNPLRHPEGEDENNVEFRVNYRVTDADGDAVDGHFLIDVDDDTPEVLQASNDAVPISLDDDALSGNPDGPQDDAPDSVHALGTVVFTYGADGGSMAWQTAGLPTGFGFTFDIDDGLDSDPSTLTISQNGTPVLMATLDKETGAYEVTQSVALDHRPDDVEDNLDFTLTYRVTDNDGDTVDGTLSLSVDDDTPTVTANDAVQLDDGNFPLGNDGGDGDVDPNLANVSGTLGHSYGADGSDGLGGIAWLTQDDSGLPSGFRINSSSSDGNLLIEQEQGAGNWVVVVQATLTDPDGVYEISQTAPVVHAADNNTEGNVPFTIFYEVTDSDGDTVKGSLAIDVDDDTPILSTEGPQDSSVDEEDIPDSDGNVDQGLPGDIPNSDDMASGGLGILWGADNNDAAPGPVRTLTFQDTTDAAANVTIAGETLSGPISIDELSDVTSVGFPIDVSFFGTDGDTIVGHVAATAPTSLSDPAIVFVVTLIDGGGSDEGSYTFDLRATLDHPGIGLEDDLDFTFDFRATDSDGDIVDGAFTVTVDDDSPVVNSQNNPLIQLDDETLDGGIPGDSGNGDDPESGANILTGVLDHSFGADNAGGNPYVFWATDPSEVAPLPGGFRYAPTNNSETLIIQQDQDSVWIDVVQLTLTQFAPTSAGQEYTVQQLAPVLHAPGQQENNIQFDVVYGVQDGDLDRVDGTLTINIDDDAPTITGPIAGVVDEENLAVDTETHNDLYSDDLTLAQGDDGNLLASGDLTISWGADSNDVAFRTLTFKDTTTAANNVTVGGGGVITSAGDDIEYVLNVDDNVLTARTVWVEVGATDVNANGVAELNFQVRDVFTVSLDETGSGEYVFELMAELDHNVDDVEDDIALTFDFRATDRDDDVVDGSFTVTVDDDGPVIGTPVDDDVDEERLVVSPTTTHDSGYDGDLEQADGDDGDVIGSGSLDIFWGADDSTGDASERKVTFFDTVAPVNNLVVDGVSALSSGGEPIEILLNTAGDDLTAQTIWVDAGGGVNADGLTEQQFEPTLVFTVFLTDAGAGAYTFEQHAPLDHDGIDTEDDIGLTFKFTATDADGDTDDGEFTVTVDDDAPVVTTTGDVGGQVEEEMLTGQSVGNPEANDVGDSPAPDAGTDWLDQVAVTGSVSGLFTVGADEPLTYGFTALTDSQGAATAALTALTDQGLASQGGTLSYSVSSATLAGVTTHTLTGFVDGGTEADRDVFTLDLVGNGTSAGSYTFTLIDQLDHSTGAAENTLGIQFGAGLVVATDFDGDSVTDDAGTDFTITVVDDVPIVTTTGDVGGQVEEEMLTGQSVGNPEANDVGDSPAPDAGTDWLDQVAVTGSVSGLFTVGADEPLTYGFTALTDSQGAATAALTALTDQGLASQGGTLSYSVSSATLSGVTTHTLTGFVDGGTEADRDVFTLDLVGNGTSAGSYTFTLIDQLDHSTGAAENTLGIQFGAGLVVATDFDGDSVTDDAGTDFTITVVDDVPIVTVVANSSADLSSIDLVLDESIGNDPGGDGDRAGATDDVGSNTAPVYLLAPTGFEGTSQAIGKVETAGDLLDELFTVTANIGADEPGTRSDTLSLRLGNTVNTTSLYATQTGAAALLGLSGEDLRILLHEVSDTVVEGRIAGDGNSNAFVAFRITLTDETTPSSAAVVVEQFMAIDHDGSEDPSAPDEQAALLLATGGSLDLRLTTTLIDEDGDQASSFADVTLVGDAIGDGDGSFISFEDDGPVLTSATDGMLVNEPGSAVAGTWDGSFGTDGLSQLAVALGDAPSGYAFVISDPDDGGPITQVDVTPPTGEPFTFYYTTTPGVPAQLLAFGDLGLSDPFFTMTMNADETWVFDLHSNEIVSRTEIDFGNVDPGNYPMLFLPQETTTDPGEPFGVRIDAFEGATDLDVNPSNQGLGVGSSNINEGQTLIFDFFRDQSQVEFDVTKGTGGGGSALMTLHFFNEAGVELSFSPVDVLFDVASGSSPDPHIIITVGDNPAALPSVVTVLGDPGESDVTTVTIPAEFDTLNVAHSGDGSGGGGPGFNLDNLAFDQVAIVDDLAFNFDFKITDGDGDMVTLDNAVLIEADAVPDLEDIVFRDAGIASLNTDGSVGDPVGDPALPLAVDANDIFGLSSSGIFGPAPQHFAFDFRQGLDMFGQEGSNDIDSLHVLSDGSIVFSTTGMEVSTLSQGTVSPASDQADLFVFDPSSPGTVRTYGSVAGEVTFASLPSTGTGSDFLGNVDIDALAILPDGAGIVFSTSAQHDNSLLGLPDGSGGNVQWDVTDLILWDGTKATKIFDGSDYFSTGGALDLPVVDVSASGVETSTGNIIQEPFDADIDALHFTALNVSGDGLAIGDTGLFVSSMIVSVGGAVKDSSDTTLFDDGDLMEIRFDSSGDPRVVSTSLFDDPLEQSLGAYSQTDAVDLAELLATQTDFVFGDDIEQYVQLTETGPGTGIVEVALDADGPAVTEGFVTVGTVSGFGAGDFVSAVIDELGHTATIEVDDSGIV